MHPTRTRTVLSASRGEVGRAALVLAIAGAAFAAYPILRGSGSEAGLAGAELYARDAWLIAHVLGMAGFAAIGWGLGVVDRLAGRLALAGALLVLPYYGAEAFGLHALGQRVLETGDASAIAAADLFRYQPLAMTMFVAGLVLVAGAGVRLLLKVRHGPGGQRIGLLLTGAALATYLPQFFVPIGGRIGHGVVLGLGLLALAGTLLTRTSSPGQPATQPEPVTSEQ